MSRPINDARKAKKLSGEINRGLLGLCARNFHLGEMVAAFWWRLGHHRIRIAWHFRSIQARAVPESESWPRARVAAHHASPKVMACFSAKYWHPLRAHEALDKWRRREAARRDGVAGNSDRVAASARIVPASPMHGMAFT